MKFIKKITIFGRRICRKEKLDQKEEEKSERWKVKGKLQYIEMAGILRELLEPKEGLWKRKNVD